MQCSEADNDFSELHPAVWTVPAAADGDSVTMSGRNSLPELVDDGDSRYFPRAGSHDAPVQQRAAARSTGPTGKYQLYRGL